MTFSEDSNNFMTVALREAKRAFENDEVPVGAVIVHNNKIIAKGSNQIEMLKDPTAHAEMIAITSASSHLNNWRLNECDIYVTLEPCIMCTGALIAARIRTIYFSVFDTKFGACGSVHNLAEGSKSNHKINVYSGLMMEESKSLLYHFFNLARNKKSGEDKTDLFKTNLN
jgi:tRNA(adenine34) deaminase